MKYNSSRLGCLQVCVCVCVCMCVRVYMYADLPTFPILAENFRLFVYLRFPALVHYFPKK